VKIEKGVVLNDEANEGLEGKRGKIQECLGRDKRVCW
jgi:hypothetical protein